jgi:hypothetical protein
MPEVPPDGHLGTSSRLGETRHSLRVSPTIGAHMLIAREIHADPPPDGSVVLPVDVVELRAAGESWLACRSCGSFVAESRARVEMAGAHVHTFINPAGTIYRVGCFAEAPGLREIGEASAHWTWFPGFEWQVGICRTCYEHLGWSYRSSSARFVALIMDKIVERGSVDGPASPRDRG